MIPRRPDPEHGAARIFWVRRSWRYGVDWRARREGALRWRRSWRRKSAKGSEANRRVYVS
jgi:hypothetical protein